MKALFNYFVYGSWWVAICAASLAMLSWFELTGGWWNSALFVLILGSTLVIYNLNMISGLKELQELGTDSERHHWCIQNELKMKLTLGLGLILSAISIPFLNPVIWLLMIPLGVVAVAYAMPVFRRNASKTRIREIGLWKIFLIAAVWAGMTVILPSVQLYGFEQITNQSSWFLAIERAIFIIAITLPFDIRDLINDAKKGVKTIPSTIGSFRSVLLALTLLLFCIFLQYLRISDLNNLFYGYLVAYLITMLGVSYATPNRSDMYCSFWIEGTMPLLTALIFAFQYL